MTSRWHTVCAYHFDERGTDDLVLDAVRPLVRGCGAEAAYFTRHWRRGPHVRLNVLAAADALRGEVLPAAYEVLGGYLRRHPSTATPDALALLPGHRRLAAAERERGPLWPWRADNSVHVEAHDPRAHVLGGDAAADAIAGFHVAANESAFTAMEAVRGGEQRLWLAFDLIAATAHTFAAGGLPRGFVSFRAHAEVFLAGTPAPDPARAEWDRRSALARNALRDRLTRLETPSAVVGGWLAALRSFSELGYALVDSGELRLDGAPVPPAAAEALVPPGASAFLRELITNEDFHRQVVPSPGFARYRLLLNLLYLQLTRIGVRAVDRYLLCHLLADTVEDVYGLSSLEALRDNVKADL